MRISNTLTDGLGVIVRLGCTWLMPLRVASRRAFRMDAVLCHSRFRRVKSGQPKGLPRCQVYPTAELILADTDASSEV